MIDGEQLAKKLVADVDDVVRAIRVERVLQSLEQFRVIIERLINGILRAETIFGNSLFDLRAEFGVAQNQRVSFKDLTVLLA